MFEDDLKGITERFSEQIAEKNLKEIAEHRSNSQRDQLYKESYIDELAKRIFKKKSEQFAEAIFGSNKYKYNEIIKNHKINHKKMPK